MFTVEPLHAGIQVDAFRGLVFPLIYIYGYPTQNVDDVLESVKVGENIVVDFDAHKLAHYPAGQFRTPDGTGMVDVGHGTAGYRYFGIPRDGDYSDFLLFFVDAGQHDGIGAGQGFPFTGINAEQEDVNIAIIGVSLFFVVGYDRRRVEETVKQSGYTTAQGKGEGETGYENEYGFGECDVSGQISHLLLLNMEPPA